MTPSAVARPIAVADLRVRLLLELREDDLALASDAGSGEEAAASGEELAATAISVALPEERLPHRRSPGPVP